ncbi:MAG TPA: chemotaxis protein CheD [Anaerohalosphaeraceae bacterium]|nr:chemotaxis protein CheD [Anaerohalosphaeraceae bacterium]HOL89660.1 chemotaxis protein CheD [Anaerohalosphaeraceae bacterium]HPP56598.1 chemotaxis protein CheD [Anaerohalosphaeraceae bacterium]
MLTAVKKNIVVQVSDARISTDPDSVLVTYSLGSCIAVALYDPALTIGGMIHYQLPESAMDPQRAEAEPFLFCDTGMDVLMANLQQLGADKYRIIVKAAGGAAMKTGPQGFDIGKRNFLALRKVLWKYGLLLKGHDVGGDQPRNLYLYMNDGTVVVKSGGIEKNL